MELQINMLAVLVAVVANFILGFIWYTPLFGKAWGKEMGYDPNEKPVASTMIRGMSFMLIGNFFFAYVFAHNIAAWDFVPGADTMTPPQSALNAALFSWLGFYLPGQLGATVWEKHSWKLFAINTGYSLASLVVVAVILTHWR
jgi:hypothetical protein